MCLDLDSKMHFGYHTSVTDTCLSVSNCTFLSCSNAGAEGGAIKFKAEHGIEITNSEFLACLATTDGGALYIDTNKNDHLVSVTFCYFYLCYTRYRAEMWTRTDMMSKGGAVYIAAKHVDLTSNRFLQNTVYEQGFGGSVYACVNQIDMSFCTIGQSEVTCNESSYGGGVYIEYCDYETEKPEVFADLRFMNFTTCTSIYGSAVAVSKVNNQVIMMNHTVFQECSDLDVISTILITKNGDAEGDPTISLGSAAFIDERLVDNYEYMKLIDGPEHLVYNAANGVNFRIYTTKFYKGLFSPPLPLSTGVALIAADSEYHWDVEYPTVPAETSTASATTEVEYVPTPSASPEADDGTLGMAALICIIIASIIAVIGLLVGVVILLKGMGYCKFGNGTVDQPEMGTKQVGYF